MTLNCQWRKILIALNVIALVVCIRKAAQMNRRIQMMNAKQIEKIILDYVQDVVGDEVIGAKEASTAIETALQQGPKAQRGCATCYWTPDGKTANCAEPTESTCWTPVFECYKLKEPKTLTVEDMQRIMLEEMSHATGEGFSDQDEIDTIMYAQAIHAALPPESERIKELEAQVKFIEESFKPIMDQLESAEAKIARAIEYAEQRIQPDKAKVIIKILEEKP